MGLGGGGRDRTGENLSSLNYGLAFGMTFKMLPKEGNKHCTAKCENNSTSPTTRVDAKIHSGRRHRLPYMSPRTGEEQL
jgi:hypothetical protein